MKKVLSIMAIALLLMGSVSFASTTGRGDYTTPIPGLTNWLNNNPDFYHGHGYTDTWYYNDYSREMPLGVGIDFIVWKTASPWLTKATLETKYDILNEETSIFLVGTVDVFDIVSDWLN